MVTGGGARVTSNPDLGSRARRSFGFTAGSSHTSGTVWTREAGIRASRRRSRSSSVPRVRVTSAIRSLSLRTSPILPAFVS